MSGTSPNRLWLASDGVTFACERVECAGDMLAAKIVRTPRLVSHADEIGMVYHLMLLNDLAELAPLAEAAGMVLECRGGHIKFDRASKQLVET